MHIGIAILTDTAIHNLAREMVFDMQKKYHTRIENALLPQHISLKQSFPYNGKVEDIENYFEKFCSSIEPVKVSLQNVEINRINEDTVLGWIKVTESKALRDIHLRICQELKSEFNIDPLGFDGDNWRFHSTLITSRVDINLLDSLIQEYDKRNISVCFEAKKIVMFCNIGDPTRTSEYFSLKIFDIGK
jgi:hypothetical protein